MQRLHPKRPRHSHLPDQNAITRSHPHTLCRLLGKQAETCCACRCEALWQAAQLLPPEQRDQILAAQLPKHSSAPHTPPQSSQAQAASSNGATETRKRKHHSPDSNQGHPSPGTSPPSAAPPTSNGSGQGPQPSSNSVSASHAATPPGQGGAEQVNGPTSSQGSFAQKQGPSSPGRSGKPAAQPRSGVEPPAPAEAQQAHHASRHNLTANRDAAGEAGRRSLAALQAGDLAQAVRLPWAEHLIQAPVSMQAAMQRRVVLRVFSDQGCSNPAVPRQGRMVRKAARLDPATYGEQLQRMEQLLAQAAGAAEEATSQPDSPARYCSLPAVDT